jgi:DNA-binding NarL/FixJ family response regulator
MKTQIPVGVVIARFEDLARAGLRTLIEEDPNLTILAEDVPLEGLGAELRRLEPQVAILNFGSLRSTADVRTLHAEHPATRIVVLANRPSPAECNQMLAFGATACLSKEIQARDILNAIHLASRGLHVLPRTADVMPVSAGPELLTRREADVLEHLQRGSSNGEIALALGVSIETVRTHARNIYRKLGVSTRRELATLNGVGSTS